MGGYVAFPPIYACQALIKQPVRGDFKKVSRATKQPIQCENGLVLTPEGPYWGGGRLGIPGVGTWDPTMGNGVHVQESSAGPRSKYTHSGHNTQRRFDPPPPQKKGYAGAAGAGAGVRIQKIIGGSFLVLK